MLLILKNANFFKKYETFNLRRPEKCQISIRSNKINKETRKQARRKVLKIAATGGAAASIIAIPKQWTKPVIDTVLLPAHAATTEATTQAATTTAAPTPTLSVFSGSTTVNIAPGAAIEQQKEQASPLLDLFINQATAQPVIRGATLSIYAEETSTGTYRFDLLYVEDFPCKASSSIGTYTGFASNTSSSGAVSFSSAGCPEGTFTAEITYSVGPSGMTVEGTVFGFYSFSVLLSQGGSGLSPQMCVDCPPPTEDFMFLNLTFLPLELSSALNRT